MGAPSAQLLQWNRAANMTGHDIMTGLYKALVFGVVVMWVCCYKGYHAERMATGVSRATTEAVVLSSVLILALGLFSYVDSFVIGSHASTIDERNLKSTAATVIHRRSRRRPAPGNAIEVRGSAQPLRPPAGARWRQPGLSAGQITTIVGPSGWRQDRAAEASQSADAPGLGHDNDRWGRSYATRRYAALNEVREKFGMLFQAGALFDSMSMFDNVAFPLVEKTHLSRDEIAERVHETLKAVGLEGMEAKYPSRDQRRNAEAGRARARTDSPPEDSDARRADHRPRSVAHRRDSRADPRARSKNLT